MSKVLKTLDEILSLLKARSNLDKKVLNASEACAYLGITKWALYHMTSRNQIPHYKHGRSLRFIRSELDEWIQSHKVLTAEEIEEAAASYLNRNTSKSNRR